MRRGDLARMSLVAVIGGCGFHVAGGVAGGDGGPDAPDSSIDALIDAPGDAAPDTPISTTLRRVKLSFKNATRNIALDGFVALIPIDATRVDYAAIKAGGANIRFTDADGTPLPYEIESWTANGLSNVWVRVPSIDAASDADYIYLHYGDPALTDAQDASAVWVAQSSVWHLSQDPGPGGVGEIKDSAAAHNHGTATAAMQQGDLTAAVIGKGLFFAGSGGTGVQAALMTLPLYTWQMWVKGANAPLTTTSNRDPINNGDVNFNFAWDHSQAAFTGAAAQRDATQWRSVAPLTNLAATTWYFIAGTYDGTNLCIYKDGDAGRCTAAGAPLAPVGDFEIGLASSGASSFNGWMDEVRVAPAATSAVRLNAEYVNQRASNATPFVVFSPPEPDI